MGIVRAQNKHMAWLSLEVKHAAADTAPTSPSRFLTCEIHRKPGTDVLHLQVQQALEIL